jgi:beta-N-acetylhexosaminidase
MRMRSFSFRISIWLLVPSVSLALVTSHAVSKSPEQLLADMTTEEKVGQLFLVTFSEKDISSTSDIYQLITSYHVGGVLIKRESGNWRSGEGEAVAVQSLSNGLQQIVENNIGVKAGNSTEFIPLFIAISGGTDGYPYTQLATELTSLPTEMTIGATWDPSMAEATGVVLGKELSLLGINMYLGPSLDVLERPNPGTTGDLGSRTFGGDPFWVGTMGREYIFGIQEGSNKQMAVIATHFPGIGASDRSPDEEVATIRKALEDLRLIDLAPFAAVANATPGTSGIADGFLVSHIRYQGLQGNIRTSTRPVSLDPQALNTLMNLPEFLSWREDGGITVSESLGTQSIRKYYDPTESNFSGRYIALNAFQAGNDILQLSNFSNPNDASELVTIKNTIEYFQQMYRTDGEFAAKVDQAVLRILALKKRMYPVFSIDRVLRSPDSLGQLKEDEGISSGICKAGATLISPNPKVTGGTGIERPSTADRIIIFTDSRSIVPCPSCPAESDIAPTNLADTIIKLYGPGASGIIASSRIQSFSFRDLYASMLGVSLPDLDTALSNSTTIIALIQNPTPSIPESFAVQNLLAQKPELARNKKIIIFALAAPYYLDSTEISELYAYYGLYSKNNNCIETAARLLFGDQSPLGSSPVGIDGVGYDLLSALAPDPNQVIQISVSLTGLPPQVTPKATATQNPTITATPSPIKITLGDTLHLSAGPILDHNGHVVPDGTPLRFQIEYPSENIPPLYLDTATKQGIAQADYTLDRKGEMRITASSEPARQSTILSFVVSEQSSVVTIEGPMDITGTPPSASPTISGTPAIAAGNGRQGARVGGDTFIAMVVLLCVLMGVALFLSHHLPGKAADVRIALSVLVGGLAGYDYMVLGFPGAFDLASWGGRWIAIPIGIVGSIAGFAIVWWLENRPKGFTRSGGKS